MEWVVNAPPSRLTLCGGSHELDGLFERTHATQPTRRIVSPESRSSMAVTPVPVPVTTGESTVAPYSMPTVPPQPLWRFAAVGLGPLLLLSLFAFAVEIARRMG